MGAPVLLPKQNWMLATSNWLLPVGAMPKSFTNVFVWGEGRL
jgi:hypothetical protein